MASIGHPGRGWWRRVGGAAAVLVYGAGYAHANYPSNGVILEYFEQEWDDMERRMPDAFMAGYNGFWVPPPSFASFGSAGYDPFDRFSLGTPPILTTSGSRTRTTYGTADGFKAMIEEAHRANTQIFVDAIFNHTSARSTSDAFIADGGWPGFYIPRESPAGDKQPTDDWGDFHQGNANGYLQSEDPNGSNYNLTDGDLVALCDIDQSTNHQFIRHPVAAGNADNIPAGNVRNLPNAGNAALYQDRQLTPLAFTNPGTSRHSGLSFTRFPYNLANPMAGDAVKENATGMLMRWAQWLLEVYGVDGYRLDAHKHVPTFFWDQYYDSAVYLDRTDFFGNKVTPFSFGENVTGNFDMLANYVRKDGFGNRDALDLQGAARLREIINAGGFGSWGNIQSNTDSGHLDVADDGLVNGTMGVNHVFSHDNGSVGNGGSLPAYPTIQQQGLPEHAYMLMRPGRSIVYHNARGITIRSSGFYPREGSPNALGKDPTNSGVADAMTTLVKLHNELAYGEYYQLNASTSDVLVFQRALNGQANCLVGVNDRWDSGVQTVTVTTSYPQGTRLHEQTGNAANATVDPTNTIPEVIVVGASGTVQLKVPNNASTAGNHGRGYVVYSESLPDVSLSIVGASGTVPPDPTTYPDFLERLTAMPIVSSNTFEIRLDTAQSDASDPNSDDNALFRINQGNRDWNGNGSIDIPTSTLVIGGYEQFVTQNSPSYGSGSGTGVYRQTIDATELEEGPNYISAIAFRKRPSGTTPLFAERAVVCELWTCCRRRSSWRRRGKTFEDATVETHIRACSTDDVQRVRVRGSGAGGGPADDADDGQPGQEVGPVGVAQDVHRARGRRARGHGRGARGDRDVHDPAGVDLHQHQPVPGGPGRERVAEP
ncbi:MAG: alpha-amylase family glycosyl hydrolase [Phycisphaerales bacterium]